MAPTILDKIVPEGEATIHIIYNDYIIDLCL
jgi:hypothetical protein